MLCFLVKTGVRSGGNRKVERGWSGEVAPYAGVGATSSTPVEAGKRKSRAFTLLFHRLLNSLMLR